MPAVHPCRGDMRTDECGSVLAGGLFAPTLPGVCFFGLKQRGRGGQDKGSLMHCLLPLTSVYTCLGFLASGSVATSGLGESVLTA